MEIEYLERLKIAKKYMDNLVAEKDLTFEEKVGLDTAISILEDRIRQVEFHRHF